MDQSYHGERHQKQMCKIKRQEKIFICPTWGKFAGLEMLHAWCIGELHQMVIVWSPCLILNELLVSADPRCSRSLFHRWGAMKLHLHLVWSDGGSPDDQSDTDASYCRSKRQIWLHFHFLNQLCVYTLYFSFSGCGLETTFMVIDDVWFPKWLLSGHEREEIDIYGFGAQSVIQWSLVIHQLLLQVFKH